jgi:hypothetical protein
MIPGYQNGNFLDIHGADFINDTEEQLHDKLNQLDKNQLILFNYCSEHYGPHDGILYMYDQFVKHNLNFILLCHDITDHLAKPNILFYPYWYYHCKTFIPKYYFNRNISNLEKKFKISCLNGKPRFNRIYNYILLREKEYFKDLLFTFHNGDAWRHDDLLLDIDIQNKWDHIKNTLIHRPDSLNPIGIDNEAYNNSYINLVTETAVIPKLFVTEKIWKPIASGQLFIVLGSMGTIDYLREQGVDTFDDIIDHTYYDNEPDWKIRVLKLHELIDNLLNEDLYKINAITQDRRKKNAEKFYAGKFDNQYLDQLEQKVITCIRTQNQDHLSE